MKHFPITSDVWGWGVEGGDCDRDEGFDCGVGDQVCAEKAGGRPEDSGTVNAFWFGLILHITKNCDNFLLFFRGWTFLHFRRRIFGTGRSSISRRVLGGRGEVGG